MHSFSQAAYHFGRLASGEYRRHLEPVLDLIGQTVKTEMERSIGTLVPAIGGYQDMPDIEQSTKDRKRRSPVSLRPDDPLYRTGDYSKSIQYKKHAFMLAVEVGTNVKYVVYHELGTRHHPARPIMGPAVLKALPPLLPMIQAAGVMAMKGGWIRTLAAEGMLYTKAAGERDILD